MLALEQKRRTGDRSPLAKRAGTADGERFDEPRRTVPGPEIAERVDALVDWVDRGVVGPQGNAPKEVSGTPDRTHDGTG